MFIRHLPLNVNRISSLKEWIDLEATYFKTWTWYDFPINVDATHIYLWHLILKICRPVYQDFLSTYMKAQPEALIGSALLTGAIFVLSYCFVAPRSPWGEVLSQAWSSKCWLYSKDYRQKKTCHVETWVSVFLAIHPRSSKLHAINISLQVVMVI